MKRQSTHQLASGPRVVQRRAWATAVVLAIAAALASGCASAPPRPEGGVAKGDTAYLQARLDYEIEKVLEDTKSPSLVISLVDDVGPVFEKAYGIANVATKTPATTDTPYRIGSNSKLFVMLSLLKLEEERKLDLDAPLSSVLDGFSIGPPPAYIPEASGWKLEDITLRRMLTHHSGLPNDVLLGFMGTDPLPLDKLLPLVTTMRAEAPSDLVASYSNLAFALLGIVVERVSGDPFDVYVEKNFFAPYQMSHATFRWSDEVSATLARPYDKGEKKPLYKISMWPAGRAMASATDMGRFASALLRGGDDVISPAALKRSYAHQNGDVTLDLGRQMGLTWFRSLQDTEHLGPSVEHGGDTLYHHSAFALLPEQKLAVFVASNDAAATMATRKIASLALALALEAKTGAAVPEPAPPASHQASSPHPERFDGVEGKWASMVGAIEVKRAGDVAHFDAMGTTLELRPLEAGGLGLWAKLFGFISLRPDELAKIRLRRERIGGRELLVGRQGNNDGVFAIRYTPTPAPPVWRAREGVYVPPKATDDDTKADAKDFVFLHKLELEFDDVGQAMVRAYPKDSPSVARPLMIESDTEAVTIGIGRGQSQWVTVDGDALLIAGLRFERQVEVD